MRHPETQIVRRRHAVVKISNGEIMVVTPDGMVQHVSSARDAATVLDRWTRQHLEPGATIGALWVEWQGVMPPSVSSRR